LRTDRKAFSIHGTERHPGGMPAVNREARSQTESLPKFEKLFLGSTFSLHHENNAFLFVWFASKIVVMQCPFASSSS
jgi:hypothetical protein